MNECMYVVGQWSASHGISCICGDSVKQNKKQEENTPHTGGKGRGKECIVHRVYFCVFQCVMYFSDDNNDIFESQSTKQLFLLTA